MKTCIRKRIRRRGRSVNVDVITETTDGEFREIVEELVAKRDARTIAAWLTRLTIAWRVRDIKVQAERETIWAQLRRWFGPRKANELLDALLVDKARLDWLNHYCNNEAIRGQVRAAIDTAMYTRGAKSPL